MYIHDLPSASWVLFSLGSDGIAHLTLSLIGFPSIDGLYYNQSSVRIPKPNVLMPKSNQPKPKTETRISHERVAPSPS